MATDTVTSVCFVCFGLQNLRRRIFLRTIKARGVAVIAYVSVHTKHQISLASIDQTRHNQLPKRASGQFVYFLSLQKYSSQLQLSYELLLNGPTCKAKGHQDRFQLPYRDKLSQK